MAYFKRSKRNRTRTKRSTRRLSRVKRSKRTRKGGMNLTTFAFKLGQVQRGRENPNSQITESYEKGKSVPVKKKRKPLF